MKAFVVLFVVGVGAIAHGEPLRRFLPASPDTHLLQAKLFNALDAFAVKHGDRFGNRLRIEVAEPWGERTVTLEDGTNHVSCTADFGESIPPATGGYDPHYSCRLELSSGELVIPIDQSEVALAGLLSQALVDTSPRSSLR